MSLLKNQTTVTDNLTDAIDITKNLGKSITKNLIDKNAAIQSLAALLKKLESAKYFVDRG